MTRLPTLWLLCLVCLSRAGTALGEDYLLKPALPIAEPKEIVLLDITRAGSERLVAVGERGGIVYSDDGGSSWQQGTVPLSETLTAVSFPVADRGWAVGHGGVILHSSDRGESWQQQFDGKEANRQRLEYFKERVKTLEARVESASEPDDELEYKLEDARFDVEDAQTALESGPAYPFLDVWFADADSGWAVGAYGMIFRTDDGGKNWQIAAGGIENIRGFHYYSMDAAADGTFYLSGEAGILYRSDDGGQNWQTLGLDYEGTLFGVVALDRSRVVTFGLRGNIFFSADRGETWQRATVEDNPERSLYGGGELAHGDLVLVGAGGVIASSPDGTQFTAQTHGSRDTFSAALWYEGDLLVVGLDGLARIQQVSGGEG